MSEDVMEAKGTIEFSDFQKIDLRVGRIVSAERIPKKDRLLKLEVSFGEDGNRTIVAGIAESYDPNALVGRQSIFVLNLAPRKMAGIESHGMILAAKRSDGVIALAEVSSPVADGAGVG